MTDAITRILVPVDFSPHSDRALRHAIVFARRFGSTLELVHVVENPFGAAAWSSEMYIPDVTEIMSGMIAEAGRRLGELRNSMASQGIPIETAVLSGHPAQTIVERAGNGGVELIVMGTHGRTGLPHFFMGSVAERVVRTAPCPVLTIRDTASPPERGATPGTVA